MYTGRPVESSPDLEYPRVAWCYDRSALNNVCVLPRLFKTYENRKLGVSKEDWAEFEK